MGSPFVADDVLSLNRGPTPLIPGPD